MHYIIWLEQKAKKSLILQPMAGNNKNQKIKKKIKIRYGIKKKITSVAALKMII